MRSARLSSLSDAAVVASPRVASVDRLRGGALALMVLDRTLLYLHAGFSSFSSGDATFGTISLFVTTWFARVAVPVFIFATGVWVCLEHAKGIRTAELSRFLVTRGLVLMALELTLVRLLAWFTWDVNFIGVLELLWVVGASMIALAVLVHLPRRDVVVFAVAVIALHNLLDNVVMPGAYGLGTTPGALGKLWILLHQSNDVFHAVGTSGPRLAVALPVVPLVGVMAAGYAFGAVYNGEPAYRVALLRRWGWGLLTGFVVLRAMNVYGDPTPWSPQSDWISSLMSFLNPTMFPASLQWLLLALGPALLLLAALEGRRPPLRMLDVFGRAPLFLYLVQLFVVHTIAIGVTFASGRDVAYLFVRQPFSERPPQGAGFGLVVVYACWAAAILVLYPLCNWFERTNRFERLRTLRLGR